MKENKYYINHNPIEVNSSDSDEPKPNFMKAANNLSKKLSSQIISESLESINNNVFSNIGKNLPSLKHLNKYDDTLDLSKIF